MIGHGNYRSNILNVEEETKPKQIVSPKFDSPSTRKTPPGPIIRTKPKLPSYCTEKRAKRWVASIVISISVVGVVIYLGVSSIRQTNADDLRPTIGAFLSNCSENGVVGRIGEQVCFNPKQSCFPSLSSELLQNVTIKQISSEYNNFDSHDLQNIVISAEKINTEYQGWIINYNASSSEQTLRIGKTSLTCHDIGEYNVTLNYINQPDESCTFKMDNSYPQLNLTFTETEEFVFVSCEINGMCLDAFLALFVNAGNETIPVRNDKQTGCGNDAAKTIRHVALQKSMITRNSSITCKPFTDDIGMTENLTTTAILCKGHQCGETCKEQERGYYFQHPIFCDKYYQCEFPTLHLRPCPTNLQWNPDACTCDLTGNVAAQCNITTKRYDPPTNAGRIRACGGNTQM